MSNAQIEGAATVEFKLDPFNPDALRIAHYPLTPKVVLGVGKRGVNGERKLHHIHDFAEGDSVTIPPHGYVVVEVEEFIKLPAGFVGEFVPPSAFIMNGFGLEAGKLDQGYGDLKGKKQRLLFGLQNKLNEDNTYRKEDGIAYISFTDLRGLRLSGFDFNDPDTQRLMARFFKRLKKAEDDGPFYEE